MQHPLKKKPRRRLARRWIVLASFAALALAAVFLRSALNARDSRPALKVSSPAGNVRALEIRDASTLKSVSMRPYGGEPYELRMDGGHLRLVQGEELTALDETSEQTLLQALTEVVVQGTVADDVSEVAGRLSDMGLSPALASAVLRYTDGTEATLEVGETVPNTTYAYFRWSGDPGVHMCDMGIADAFGLSAERLLPIAQLQVAPSLVETLRLQNANGDCLFRFENGATGYLETPIVYPLSESGLASLLSALQNLRLGTYQGPVTDANRADLGFDAPLCVLEVRQKAGVINDIDRQGALITSQREASVLRLVFGRQEEAFFYTCEYDGGCYLVSRFLAEALVTARWADALSRNPAGLGDEVLACSRLRTAEQVLTLEVERTERVQRNNDLATDENGALLWDTTARLNGAQITQERLNAWLDALNAFTAAGELPEGFSLPQGAQPRWSLRLLTQSGRERTIEAYRMDAFSDALAVDGVLFHYAHEDAIDALLTALGD